jgi:hypothetical protein
MDERDRRYQREGELRAEALRIKQEADEHARSLARADQTYKDEQANRLREQIGEERAEGRERERQFVTNEEYDRRHDPLVRQVNALAESMAAGSGRSAGIDKLIAYGIGAAGVIAAIISQLH